MVPLVLALSCVGAGASVLHGLGLWRGQPAIERAALAFAVGFGVVGWLVFWIGVAGWLAPGPMWALCAVLILGNGLFRVPSASLPAPPWPAPLSPAVWGLFALLAGVFALDVFEAMAPPADADTLAYHFDLPRRFVDEQRIFFVPRAMSGAIPLLVQMTHVAALTMGNAGAGELALTGWTLISGWAASLLLFALALRWLSFAWALALALLFQTLPAMIFGAGSGQVEARLALFALAAVAALMHAHAGRTRLQPAILLGLAAGLYAGSKYTGLLFATAAGVALLSTGGRWLPRGALFAVAALTAGGQWYGWNFLHTGDPVFPILFTALGLEDSAYWTADYAAGLAAALKERGSALSGILGGLTFPFVATFSPPPAFASGRVGLGPFAVLVLPAAVLGAWRYRDRVGGSVLLPVAVLIVVFYVLWAKFGGVPKVRHLLPVMAPLMLLLVVSAVRVGGMAVARPMVAAAGLTLILQIAAQGLFTKTYVHRWLAGEGRDAFLLRVLGDDYAPVIWINANADSIKRLLLFERHWLYYVRVPTYFVHPITVAAIETRDGRMEADRFLVQTRALGVSHIMDNYPDGAPPGSFTHTMFELRDRGCLALEKTFQIHRFTSRTLRTRSPEAIRKAIWRLSPESCRPIKAPGSRTLPSGDGRYR